jgi:two-component system osmolarity sensor histidine kinase EnvZ
MKLWPRSLLWRTFALLALLVLATTAGWFFIFRAYEVEPRARQLAQNLVSVVNLTRAALIAAESGKRRELLVELSDREGIQVYPAEAGETIAPPPDRPLLQLVSESLRAQLGAHTRLASARDGQPGLWVSFRIDEDEYWVRVPRERLERRFALRWIGWGSLALTLSLIAAYFIVRRLGRPLRALATAAADIGRGKRPAPIAESGPAEIATLAHAFNQMSQDLSRLDEDRALILAGVSHDLRTPLARLRLGVEMSGGEAQMKEGMAADIEEMDRIIGQFLDFARTDGGEPLESLNLAAVAAEIVERFCKLGHAIAEDLQPVPDTALRPMALRRAITNLLDNALRYGETGVAVRTYVADTKMILEVLDRGPGIPGESAERLKQPFTRLEAARSGGGGSGLGLAIVERIIRDHSGTLDLLPREGGGLVARIAFPASAPAPELPLFSPRTG